MNVNPAEDAGGNVDADLRMAEAFYRCSDSLARTFLESTTKETRRPPFLTLYQSASHQSSTT